MVRKGGKVSNLRRIFRSLYRYCECPGKDGKGCKTLIPIIKKDHPVFGRFAWQHQHIGKFGKEAVGYKTGMTEDKERGYIIIIRRHHKYAGTKGRIYLHRYLKELDLGRYITPEYDVHHIDRNAKNNAQENLMEILKTEHPVLEHTVDMSDRCCVKCNRKFDDISESHRRQWYNNKTTCFYCYKNESDKRKNNGSVT